MEEKDDFEEIKENSESETDVDEIINGDSESEEELDKKSTKKLLVMLGIIVGIFILIFAGFFIVKNYFSPTGAVTLDDLHKMNVEGGESDKNYVYKGFSFVFVDGLWYTQIQREDVIWNIPLHFGPRDLEYVKITGPGIDDGFKKKEVYITFDPTLKPLTYVALSAAELSLNLVKGLGMKPIASCLNNESDVCKDRPIITCESGEATIYIKQDNETGVILDGNCVIIQGQGYGLVKATDRFLLQWYRIMK